MSQPNLYSHIQDDACPLSQGAWDTNVALHLGRVQVEVWTPRRGLHAKPRGMADFVSRVSSCTRTFDARTRSSKDRCSS